MSEAYDIAIVGAGPGGSSAAIRLAQSGKRVVLIEKEKFPRQKLCGEFISPECLEHFAELGVLDRMQGAGGVEISETVFYSRGGRGVVVPSAMFGGLHQNALGLSRAEMDLQLMLRARDAGVEVREQTSTAAPIIENGRVSGITIKNDCGQGIVASPVIIDATGRTRALARKLASGSPSTRAEAVAFKTHVRNVDIPNDRCEIFSYRGGYGGTSRVEDGLYNICFIAAASDVKTLASDPSRVFREVVCSNRRAAHVFRNVEFVDTWLAVSIERFGGRILSPVQGLLTVGDAAAFIDPFTGSGMLLALESGKIAAECILDTPDLATLATEYERRYAAAFDNRLRICAWLRRASFVPFLADLTILGLSLSSTLKDHIVRATRAEKRGPNPG
ncbi:MAG: NAD(P)/FAD-dependent oxidoreductase [Acidobacteria bacterium]|nr:NAD(P)/FAD-dependent oxidoreductase [Acidobacteriota bacterium]